MAVTRSTMRAAGTSARAMMCYRAATHSQSYKPRTIHAPLLRLYTSSRGTAVSVDLCSSACYRTIARELSPVPHDVPRRGPRGRFIAGVIAVPIAVLILRHRLYGARYDDDLSRDAVLRHCGQHARS